MIILCPWKENFDCTVNGSCIGRSSVEEEGLWRYYGFKDYREWAFHNVGEPTFRVKRSGKGACIKIWEAKYILWSHSKGLVPGKSMESGCFCVATSSGVLRKGSDSGAGLGKMIWTFLLCSTFSFVRSTHHLLSYYIFSFMMIVSLPVGNVSFMSREEYLSVLLIHIF